MNKDKAFERIEQLEAALRRIATGQYDVGAIGIAVNALEPQSNERHGLGTYNDGMVKLGYRSGSSND